MLLFLSQKKKTPPNKHIHTKKTVGYTRTIFLQTGKNTKWAETCILCLLFIFKAEYWDHVDTVTSLHMGFHRERMAPGLRPSGISTYIYISYPHWILLMPVFQWHYKHRLSTCKQRTCVPVSLELLHSANDHNTNHKNMRFPSFFKIRFFFFFTSL